MLPPLITLEEHYVSRSLKESPFASRLGLESFPADTTKKLLDLTEERIKDMDRTGVAVQVVSHNPAAGALPLEMCQQANDQLFEDGITAHSKRLRGLATLPMNKPAEAADELSRCIRDLKFVGALISNRADGRCYDDEFYWPVFERAQDLDIPIYLHPTFLPETNKSLFEGNYGEAETQALAAWSWGWHSDVGLHFLKLYASGLFDRFPGLKLILGHDGEMLPFMIDRIERFTKLWPKKERSILTVYEENIWFTTSGMFSLAPLGCLLRTTSIDKVMYSVDYPFEDNMMGKKFLEEVQRSGMLSKEDLEKLAYRNAEKLLRISID